MSIRVVHYINQFFAGKGGEGMADYPLEVVQCPVGPGQLLQRELKDGTIVLTLVCGDGYFGAHEKDVLNEIRTIIQNTAPDIVVTGPAFSSGRYGLSCGAVAACAMNDCSVPAIAGMSSDNSAVEIYRSQAYVVPSGESVRNMANAIQKMAKLAIRLGNRQPIGTSDEEGYIPRGIRKNIRHSQTAETRAADLLLQKLRGEKPTTELKLNAGNIIQPPPPIPDLSKATIAIVTECGIVPKGNPDHIEGVRTKKWSKYSLKGLLELTRETHESIHGGYDNSMINIDPNRGVPLDALRMLEEEGFFHNLYDTYYVTCGNWGNVYVMQQIGRTIATELKQAGVDGVLVPATWGSGTRSGATLAKELEAAGLPTVLVTCFFTVALSIGCNRIVRGVRFHYPFGNPELPPERERMFRKDLVQYALNALTISVDRPTVFEADVV